MQDNYKQDFGGEPMRGLCEYLKCPNWALRDRWFQKLGQWASVCEDHDTNDIEADLLNRRLEIRLSQDKDIKCSKVKRGKKWRPVPQESLA